MAFPAFSASQRNLRYLLRRIDIALHEITVRAERRRAAILAACGRAKPSAVAEAVNMDRSAASRLIRELVRVGLVATPTDASDARSVVLSLTAEGHRRVEAALQLKNAIFLERLASWSQKDLVLCTELLQRLLDVPNSDNSSVMLVAHKSRRGLDLSLPSFRHGGPQKYKCHCSHGRQE